MPPDCHKITEPSAQIPTYLKVQQKELRIGTSQNNRAFRSNPNFSVLDTQQGVENIKFVTK